MLSSVHPAMRHAPLDLAVQRCRKARAVVLEAHVQHRGLVLDHAFRLSLGRIVEPHGLDACMEGRALMDDPSTKRQRPAYPVP